MTDPSGAREVKAAEDQLRRAVGRAGRAGRPDCGWMESWAHELELPQTIPGVGLKTAQVFGPETGGDTSQFPSAAHLAAGAGVVPAMQELTRPMHASVLSK